MEAYRCILLGPPFPSTGKGKDKGARGPIKPTTPTFILPRQRLCRNSVHGSRASPRTELLDHKFEYLPVRPELVEGLRANCDTVSQGEGTGEPVAFLISRPLGQPQPQFSKKRRGTRKPDKEEEVQAEKNVFFLHALFVVLLILPERAQIASQRFTISINNPPWLCGSDAPFSAWMSRAFCNLPRWPWG
jgi:hypothetical protein